MAPRMDVLDTADLDEHLATVDEFRKAKEALDYWTERYDDLKHEIVAALGDAKEGLVGGALVLKRAHVEPERLNRAEMERAYPDIVRSFLEPGTPYDRVWFPKPKA